MMPNLIQKGAPPARYAIVEDSTEYRRRVVELIDRTLHWELVAERSTVARAIVDIPKSRPDVALLDIQLGAESGVDLVSAIKRESPATAIVMLTVVEDPETIVAALEAGACAYIVKGTDTELVDALRDVANGGAGMSPAVARRLVGWFQERGDQRAKGEKTLTKRQWQVLKLAARGRQQGEIAQELDISIFTVKNHFRNIYETLEVGTLTDALIKIKGGRGLLDD